LHLDFTRDGAALIRRAISVSDIARLKEEFAGLDFRAGARPFAISETVRRLIGIGGCFDLALSEVGMTAARPVRVLAFDKTPENNWNLGWHQDRIIAVKARREVEGFGTWTVKNSVPHVEAPESLMRHMAFFRLHLDPCPEENGALRIIPGSAERGKLTDAQTRDLASEGESRVCAADEGDILAVKALTLHASSPALRPSHRRVLHVDYCSVMLPHGLDWALEV
jgi:hypothetical protein